MATRDVLEVIREIVLQETLYLRHYVGQVAQNADPLQKGRVKVTIPMLGWDNVSKAPWCRPRDKHALVTPIVNEWVEVWFVEGNPSRPVYGGNVAEMQDALPKAYDGKATTHVLFQDPTTGDAVVWDSSVPEIRILGKGDNLVTYSALASLFSSIQSWLNGHTHPTAGTGPPSPPTSPISIDPSNVKAKRLRTDG